MPRVVAPKGFQFKIVHEVEIYGYTIRRVELWTKPKVRQGKKIGYINLSYEYSRCYSTHSWLDHRYHNKGLGALLYAKAIQWGQSQGWRVRSSGMSSAEAQRVWRGKSIQKWFDIKVRRGRHWRDDSHYPDGDTFYPHPKKEIKKRHGNSRVSRQPNRRSGR